MIIKDLEDKVIVWDVLKVRYLLFISDIVCVVVSFGKKIIVVLWMVSLLLLGSYVVFV